MLSQRNCRFCKPYAVICLVFLFAASGLYAAASRETDQTVTNEVVIWTYDSFISEWGPGPAIAENFEAETGIPVRFVSHGDGGALLSRLIAEGAKADADIILGLDQNLAPRALDSGLLEAYEPEHAEAIIPGLTVDDEFRLIPFDYSYFAIIYDSERIDTVPGSLEDLTDEAYKRKLILMDPRTSTPGLGFLSWTMAVYGNDWKAYWDRLAPSILTVAEGWDTGYGLFTSGEAPLVLSYTTSPAYHLEYENTERYKAAIFADGHPIQIETAGLLAAAPRKDNAKLFLEFMLTDGFQSVIPLTNWMYPVIDAELPASYRLAPKSTKNIRSEPPAEEDLNEWAKLLGGAR